MPWNTLSSEHFQIHYPEGQRAYAVRVAKIAEKVYSRLEPRYGTHNPRGDSPTHIALVFSSDLVNAFATPYGGIDQIVLFLDNPRAGDFSRFDLWAELLITHEYTHIETLRYYNSSFLFFLRVFLGFPPNLLTPPGISEGIAVYEESRNGLGRLDDPITRMILRTASLYGAFPNAGEVLTGSHRWPQGNIYYLYGGRFLRYVANTYGEAPILDYWRTDAWPSVPDSRFRHGLPYYSMMHRNFQETETAEFEKEIQETREQGLTAFERLTFDGQRKSFLFLSAEDRLLYFARPPDRIPGIYSINPQIVNSSAGPTASLSPSPSFVRRVKDSAGIAEAVGRRVYSEDYYFYPSYGLRYELYDGSWRFLLNRLRPGLNASYPSLTQDGKQLVFVERDNFERRLMIADLDSIDNEEGRVVFRVPFSGILQFASVSPDGEHVVFVVREGEAGNGALMICGIKGNADCKKIVRGNSVKTQPRFSVDGREIIFSSDADGIFNLYSFDIGTSAVRRLTRTLGGFFYPAPGAQTLYAVGYFPRGYDIVSMRYEDLLYEDVDYFSGIDEKETDLEKLDDRLPAGWADNGYEGVLAMRPFFTGLWGTGYGSLVNLGIGARDPLDRHFVSAGIGNSTPYPVAFASYDYTRFVVSLSLYYTTNYWKFREKKIEEKFACYFPENNPVRAFCGDGNTYYEQAYADLRYVSQGRYFSYQAMAGYSTQKLRNADSLRGIEYSASDMNFNGPEFIFIAGQTEVYPESISAEDGWRFIFNTQYFTPRESSINPGKFAAPFEYGIAEGGLSLYLPSFFAHHVNYLSGYGYTTYGPDREMQKVRLNRFVRGLDYGKSPSNYSAAVFTYEYRLPLLWYSNAITRNLPELILRSIGMGLFYDYGNSFDKQIYRDRWTAAYGVSFYFGLNILYLNLPEIKITVARGTGVAGELQAYVSFQTELTDTIVSGDVEKSPVLSPYHRAQMRMQEYPGYFRERSAGGVLQ